MARGNVTLIWILLPRLLPVVGLGGTRQINHWGGVKFLILPRGWDEELLLHCNRLVRQLTIASNSLQSGKCSFLLILLRLVRLLLILLLGLEEERLLLLRQARMDLQKSKLKLECNVLTHGWKLALGQQALEAMFTCNPTLPGRL